MTNLEELMTRNEVATLLRVHWRTVRRWEHAGRLPAIRIGAMSVRYRKSDVMALLEKCAATPTAVTA